MGLWVKLLAHPVFLNNDVSLLSYCYNYIMFLIDTMQRRFRLVQRDQKDTRLRRGYICQSSGGYKSLWSVYYLL